MILDREDGQRFVPQALKGLVVQIDMRRFNIRRKRRGVDSKAMVLGGNLHFACPLVENRLIGSTVAELQLECLSSERLSDELVSQADAENGNFANQLS